MKTSVLRDRFLAVVSLLLLVGGFFGLDALHALERPFLRGDSNGDGDLDIGDPIFTLVYNFQGGPAPVCLDAADANDDGGLDISDPIYSLLFLFAGGNAPPAPHPLPGHG